MEQESYDTVVKFLNGALSLLQCAHDEMVEFAVTENERKLALNIREQVLNVNRLNNKVINQQRASRVLGR
jgi:hypothetical protein